VLLQLKTIGIPDVFIFPFPTAPESAKIKSTLQSLLEIKAIQGDAYESS
jgi:HrpA-like RNA helicase